MRESVIPEPSAQQPLENYAYRAFISYSHAADEALAPALQRGLHRTVVSRSCELEDLEGSVHDAAGLATGFGDVASAGEMVGADCEVAQAGHDAGS